MAQGNWSATQNIVAFLVNLFYNRQSRHRVLRFLRVEEDSVLQRIRLLEKLPQQIVLSVCMQQEKVEEATVMLQNIVVWASRLPLREVVIFILARGSEQICQSIRLKVQELCTNPTK